MRNSKIHALLICLILIITTSSTALTQVALFDISQEEITNITYLYQTNNAKDELVFLNLVYPDGKSDIFRITKNQVLSLEMRKQYPDLLTFDGQSIFHKHLLCSITMFNSKIHAQILDDEKVVHIDYDNITGKYQSYYPLKTGVYTCHTDESRGGRLHEGYSRTSTNGSTLKSYDFAVVITDEYENINGGSSQAISTAVTTINDLNLIYKRDVAINITVTVRPETATYDITPSGPNAGNGSLAVSKYFAISEYDHGMVFHNPGGSGGSGVAGLSVVCNDSDQLADSGIQPAKALGWSEANPNTGYAFMSIVAHEVAHQFSATHTFNSNHALYCGLQISASTSYEPGSGSTLMSYAGVCSDSPLIVGQNLTDPSGKILFNTSPYFHVRSLEQIVNFISGSGNSCANGSTSGNTPPSAIANPCSASAPISIPANTPFQLTASSTDSDNDAITYTWEQYDAGPPHGGPSTNCGGTAGPIFRSYSPSSNPTRYFPSLAYIVNNSNVPPLTSIGECLPTVTRTLNFKVTARDNNSSAGGIDIGAIQLNVNASYGPLAVTSPNTLTTWSTGSSQTITWSGSNTSALCNSVNILLSIDGGYSYPYLLSSNTTNDGSESVTIPSYVPASTFSRIKVESACYTCVKFFDVSNVNFTITGTCNAPFSNICPDSLLVANYGSSLLNLGLNQAYGNELTSKTFTASGSVVNTPYNTSPQAPGPTTTCSSANFGFLKDVLRFRITGGGAFTFQNSNPVVIAVYNGVYNPSTPCTPIGTTFFYNGTAYQYANSMTLNLPATCGEYSLVYFGSSGASSTISISAPSGVKIFENSTPSASNYSYTYIAVNNNNKIISAVSSSSDFTALSGGSYCIYGVNYYSGSSNPPGNVDPASFVGQTVDQLLQAGKCMVVSSNCKIVNVNCGSSVVTSGSDSGPGTLRAVYDCIAEGGTISYQSGVNSNLTNPLTINKSVTISGNTSTTIDLNCSGSFGLGINSTKMLNLKNVMVNLSGTASSVITNNGTLTLESVVVKGNVNPVVSNYGSINIIGTSVSSVIKQ